MVNVHCITALRRWMLSCINAGDFEKAYRIRKALGVLTRREFCSECYTSLINSHFIAESNFAEVMGLEADYLAGEVISKRYTINKLFKYFKEVEKIETDRNSKKD